MGMWIWDKRTEKQVGLICEATERRGAEPSGERQKGRVEDGGVVCICVCVCVSVHVCVRLNARVIPVIANQVTEKLTASSVKHCHNNGATST